MSLTLVLVPNALQMEGVEQSLARMETRVCCVSTYAGRQIKQETEMLQPVNNILRTYTEIAWVRLYNSIHFKH